MDEGCGWLLMKIAAAILIIISIAISLVIAIAIAIYSTIIGLFWVAPKNLIPLSIEAHKDKAIR